jgi:hypothetical protein
MSYVFLWHDVSPCSFPTQVIDLTKDTTPKAVRLPLAQGRVSCMFAANMVRLLRPDMCSLSP